MSNNNNNNMSKGAKIVMFFFELQLNIKLYHWTTESYANHKATDKVLENISDLIDSFVEKYMGAFSRPVLKSGSSACPRLVLSILFWPCRPPWSDV